MQLECQALSFPRQLTHVDITSNNLCNTRAVRAFAHMLMRNNHIVSFRCRSTVPSIYIRKLFLLVEYNCNITTITPQMYSCISQALPDPAVFRPLLPVRTHVKSV